MTSADLKSFYQRSADEILADSQLPVAHEALLVALEKGEIRSAMPVDGRWEAQSWVKQAILYGFRSTQIEPIPAGWNTFHDKTAFPVRHFEKADGVRIVPGGSSVRRGAYVAPIVVIMPPAYINMGAYVDEGTMVDSHALVGSCAQIGKRVHLSAAAQVGGVLEPAGAVPVVVEDDAFVGGLCGVFEGVWVQKGAVLAAGVVLTKSTPIYDLVTEQVHKGVIPPYAVVVPGSRKTNSPFADEHGVTLGAAIIVKYRDAQTDASTALESALR